MRTLALIAMLFSFGVQAESFGINDSFRVEHVQPWGLHGFRVIGQGGRTSEVRFDCGKAATSGILVKVTNRYGRSHNYNLPADGQSADPMKCHQRLKKYFEQVTSPSRAVAGKKGAGVIELKVEQGGLFEFRSPQKTIGLR